MISAHSEASPQDDLEAQFEFAEQQLKSLLTLLDETEGCAIVALHVDQALNALADLGQR